MCEWGLGLRSPILFGGITNYKRAAMLNLLKRIWPLALLIVCVYVLDRPWGSVPALGRLFSPYHGFFQQVEDPNREGRQVLPLQSLHGEVQISYDDQGVPHIFAENDHDLYVAQGYVVARDRLWQMDFYGLAAAGRLTEVVGGAVLELDRYHRRLGMARTAAAIVSHLRETDSLCYAILEAYAKGVNAFISTLDDRSLPLEYKLLGYRPEAWSPYKSILMLMNMRHDLSIGTDDYRMSNVAAQIGAAATASLFPDYPSLESPIIPEGTLWDFEPVDVPPVPASWEASPTDGPVQGMGAAPAGVGPADFPAPTPEIGSNNWAVSGARSATGLPLLANDPHLTLSLPSIWYQIQLHAPGVNVYGVSLPGTPAVIIGFNQDVAWGVTNVGSDVLDFYRIRFRDKRRKEYWHDGMWKPVHAVIEIFHQKGGPDVKDTLYYTHHGPVVYHEAADSNHEDFPVGHAMRWTGNESQSADLLTFHYLNRAKNYDDYREALRYFAAPAQNFVYADNSNDVAITSNGRLPLKWHGQGRFLLDGTLASHDWPGWIPFAHNPHVRNPARGFVSSANQFPVDPTYPYYLAWQFAMPSRALRINERLNELELASVDDFKDLLNDNFNIDARRILPVLLADLAEDGSIAASDAYRVLMQWDYQNDARSVAASIFERWIPRLAEGIWKDDFSADLPVRYPSLDRTYQLLLEEPDSDWFDDRTTPEERETRKDIVRFTFLETLADLEQTYGPLPDLVKSRSHDLDSWAWGRVKNTSIGHLVPNFAPFSRSGVMTGGGARIVNATTHAHGPSWRMIVQLDRAWPQAWGLFPGGQSGNPGSPYYDNMIEKWAEGELNPLLFLRDAAERNERLMQTILLKGPKK